MQRSSHPVSFVIFLGSTLVACYDRSSPSPATGVDASSTESLGPGTSSDSGTSTTDTMSDDGAVGPDTTLDSGPSVDLPREPMPDMGGGSRPEMCAGEELQPDMVCVTGGPYVQGCAEDCPDKPGWFPGSGSVFLPYDPAHEMPEFQIQITEVTVESYSECIAAGDCEEPSCIGAGSNWPFDASNAEQPANCTRTIEGSEYCAWLGEQRGISMRLPTECEWEKAARGAEDARPYVGGETPPGCADAAIGGSFCGNDGLSSEVGTHPNDVTVYGVLDMIGNVRELTLSRVQGQQGDRVTRGAANGDPSPSGLAFDTLLAVRYAIADDDPIRGGVPDHGFRCVAGPPVEEAFEACPPQ